LPHELRERNRRTAAYRFAGRHVAHDPALGGDPRPAPDMEMAGEPALTSDHDEVVECCAPRDAYLPGENAAPAENDVVPDLYQIINHRTRADHGIATGSAVDRGVRADVYIVADHNPP